MLKRGKKSAKWDRTRAKLKKRFEAMGVTACEICRSTFALSFAHRLKRRFITDDTELETVALLCQKHHDEIEYSGHQQMFDAITQIIDKRGRI